MQPTVPVIDMFSLMRITVKRWVSALPAPFWLKILHRVEVLQALRVLSTKIACTKQMPALQFWIKVSQMPKDVQAALYGTSPNCMNLNFPTRRISQKKSSTSEMCSLSILSFNRNLLRTNGYGSLPQSTVHWQSRFKDSRCITTTQP